MKYAILSKVLIPLVFFLGTAVQAQEFPGDEFKPDFEITAELLEEFRTYLKDQEFTYKSALQIAVEDLHETVTEEDKESVFEESLTGMEALVAAEKEVDFDRSNKYIKRAIKREIVSAVFGERGVYEQLLFKTDKTLLKAAEILSQPGEYSRLITEGKKKAEL